MDCRVPLRPSELKKVVLPMSVLVPDCAMATLGMSRRRRSKSGMGHLQTSLYYHIRGRFVEGYSAVEITGILLPDDRLENYLLRMVLDPRS